MKKLLLISFLFITLQTVFAQDNVGIGTLTPNANALVDMETNNKGLLIPRLTTAQRLAIPTAGIIDEALLVYDLDLDIFFYWDGGAWIGFPLDNDPTNELQDLVFSNDTLTISDGTSIYLSPSAGGSDDQNLSINGDTLLLEDGGFVLLNNLTNTTILSDSSFVLNGDTISFPTDNDKDPTNELQDLSFDADSIYLSNGTAISIASFSTTNLFNDTTLVVNGDTIILPSAGINTDDQNLTLSNDTLFIEDGNFVVLPDNVNDADFDPTNELQDLAVVGDSLIINGGTNVFLGDLTSSNIINDTTLIINGDTLTLPSGGGINTDNQNLTLSNDTLFIEDGNFVVLPSGVVNTDNQNITINGDTLILEDGGFILLGDLTNITNLGDSLLILNGDTISFPADADTDPTNELQDLAVIGDSLIINGGTNVFLGDLTSSNIINDTTLIINGDTLTLPSGGGINTDDQNLTLSNDTLFIEDGNFVVLPSGVVNTDNQNITINGDTLILEDGGFILLGDLTNITNLGDTSLVLNGDTISFPADADTDPTNELQDLAVVGDSLIINGGTNVFLGDLTNTINLGDSSFVINGDTINLSNAGTDNQNLTAATLLGNTLTIDIEDGNSVSVDLGSLAAGLDSIYGQGDSLILVSNGGADTAFVDLGSVVDTDDQTLTLSNDTLFIADGNFVVLPDNVNDADFDPTNELQDLAVIGDSLIINGGTNVFLGDLTSSNIINDTTLIINGDTLTLPSGGGINTDDQNLTLSNDTLFIEDGNFVVLPSGVVNTDNQNITINGDTLILEDGGFILLGDLTNITNLGDSLLILNGDTIAFPADADTDPTNELQDLAVVGDSLIINGGTNVFLGNLTNTTNLGDSSFVINGDTINLTNAGTDNQNLTAATLLGTTLTIDIEDGTSTSVDLGSLAAGLDSIYGQGDSLILVSNGGADTAFVDLGGVVDTDDQTLTLSNDTLFIADGNFVVLPDNVNDADFDPTNELQDLAVVGDSLIINGGTNVFLGDLTSSNIINDTTLIINGDTLTLPSGGGINTDDQNLTLSNDTLFIEDGNFVVLPSGVVNTDNQNITINGDTLILEDGGFILLGDLTNITNLGDSLLILNGDTISFPADADTDPTNELQDLAVVGDSLIINGGTNVFLGDLTNTTNLGDSSFVINGDTINLTNAGTDNQNLTGATLLGTTLTIDIEDGTSTSVDLGSLAAGLDSIYGQGDSLILVSNGGADTAFVDLGGSTDTDDQTLTLSNDTLFIADGNFVVLPDNVNDADFDPTNELQDLAVVGDSLIINGGTNVFLGDLTSSNIINDTTLIINGDTLTLPSGGGINTDDQNLTLSNDTLFIEDGNFVVLPSGTVNTDNQNITINGDTLILEDGGFILLGDLTNITNLGDSLLILNGDTISFPADADTDPTNELQDLAVVGDSLIINGGTNVFLGDLTNTTNLGDSSFVINGDTINLSNAGTDNQNLTGATLLGTTLTIDIEDGTSTSVDLGSLAAGIDTIFGQGDSLILVSNGGVDTAFVDLGSSTDTDDQTLTLSNDTLFIADGNFVVLPDNVNDADFDPTNELQDLAVVGDSLIINGGTNVFLGDLTSSNIINDTTLIINGDTLTLPSGGGINTDDQNLTLSNDTLFIEDGNFVVLPSGTVNTDNQNITINGDTLILEDGGFILLGDLTNITNLGDSLLILNGDTISFPADADTDPTNELQDLAVVGDSLIINGGTNVFLGDLTDVTNLGDSAFAINGDTVNLSNAGTDNQNLTGATLLGTTLTIDIEDGTSTSVDLGSLAAGIDTIFGQGDSLILVSNGGVDTAFVNLGGSTDTDDQTLTLSNDTLFIADGNFVVLPDNVNDADFDPTNELQDLGINGDSITINGGSSISINDISNSTVINDTTIVVNGDTLIINGSGGINTDNQNITINGDTLILEDGGFILLSDITNVTNLGDTAFVLNGDTIDFPNDLDTDPTNELQDLAVVGDSLIINGGTNVYLGDLTNVTNLGDSAFAINGDTVNLSNAGTDNQNLTGATLLGTTLTIDIEDGTSTSVDLGSLAAGIDTIFGQGDSLILVSNGGVDTAFVDLGGSTDTDDQTLSILGDQLTIADGNTINLPDNVNDADFDPTNELQDLGINGDSITINGGTSISINEISNSTVLNDSTILVNGDTLIINGTAGVDTDDQTLSILGDQLTIADGNTITLPDNVNDADFDPTNELQDLGINGDSITINGGTSISINDISNSTVLNDSTIVVNGDTLIINGTAGVDTDDQTLSILGDQLTIADGNTITLPDNVNDADFDPTNELQDLGINGDSITINGGTSISINDISNSTVLNDSTIVVNGDTLIINGTAGVDTDDQTLSILGDQLTIADGNTITLPDNVNDADFDPTNELQDLGINGDSITINGGTSISINDISNSTVLNDSTIVVNGDTLIINGTAGVDTDDQTLSILGDQLTIADGNTITLPDNVNDADFDPTNELQDLGVNGDSITINGGTSISINDISNSTVLNDSTIVVNGDTLIINGTAGVDTDDQFVDQLTLDGDTMLQISLDGDGVAPLELDLTPLLGDHNTLDEAYDEGGAGAGRTITATDGDVRIDGTDGLIVLGTFGSGQVLPALPVGSKMFFYPRKAAFRAGLANGTQWNDANIGEYSFSGGRNNIASGDYSTAFGFNNSALGPYSTTFGINTTASSTGATSFGSFTSASGVFSTAFGNQTQAIGPHSSAFGFGTEATGNNSTAFGTSSLASGSNAISFGDLTQATGLNSSAFGLGTEATDFNASAFGLNTNATNSNTVAFGNQTSATASGASSFGQNSIASGRYSFSTGLFTFARSYGEFVIGSFNTDYTPSSTISFDSTDRVFVVGNGNGVGTRSNAITTLKSGNTGFGNNASVPTNLIHLNNGLTDPLRVENLATDATLDNVMVTDANGVVHIRNVSTIGGADTDDQFVDQLTLNGDTMLQISLDGDGVAPVELDLSALGDDWKLEGNAGTNPTDNFIGTTDAEELSIRTNNTEFLRVTNQGQLEVYNTGNSIFIGEQAGENDDLTNNINIAIGNNALAANDTGVYNVGIGFNSLQNNLASHNTAVGFNTLGSNISGRANSAFGFNALRVNTSGYDNTGVGFHALRFNTTGFGNTAFGRQSLALNQTGFRNTAVGVLASGNNRASDNSSFGYTALRGNINGSGNIAFGNYAGVISQGDHNTYLGFRAGDSDSTAMENTYIGAYAGGGAWTGTFGTGAEQKSGNIFLGYRSGYDENGSNKLYIENSASPTPLIYGEFDNDLVKVNGDLGVGAVVGAPTNTLHVNDGAIDPVRIENLDTDNTLDEILVQDATGVIHVRDASSLGGAGDITSVAAGDGLVGGGTSGAVTLDVVATNGLTDNANDIRLGGTLVQATVIDQGAFPLDVNLDGTGDFSVQDAGIDVFQIRDNGNMNTGRDVYFRDIDINGTNLVSITDEGNDGRLQIYENGGVSVDLNANTEFIFNEQGLDRNFRVESNARQNMLFVDAGTNRVGIGVGVPLNELHVVAATVDPLRLEGLVTDATLDNIMVTDANGVVHIRDASTLGGVDTDDQFIDQLSLSGNDLLISLDNDGVAPASVDLSNSFWSLTGNAGTNPNTNFLGTTDNQALSFRLNNTWAGRWDHIANNYFIGANSGENTTPGAGLSGQQNIGMGTGTLMDNTTGANNVAVGMFSLNSNTTGSSNAAIGTATLRENTTGFSNVAIGPAALTNNTTGYRNVALGEFALNVNTTGLYNVALGYFTLRSNVSGEYNIALGSQALESNTAGDDNIAIGEESLTNNTTGDSNIGIGRWSLLANTTGFNNQAIGNQSLRINTTGIWNTAIGLSTMFDNTTGSNNVAVGNLSHGNNATGDNNVAIGVRAGNRDISGNDNVYLGFEAGGMNSIPATFTRSRNVFIGYQAGRNETGSNRLYIESTSSATPLIYGEFDNNLVKINGDLGVGTVVGAPSNGLHVNTGAADPVRIENLATNNTLDEVLVQDASGVVHVRDASTIGGAGDVTAIIAGTGLTGGGGAGSLTVNAVGDNGLTTNANDIDLGGALNQNTTFTYGNFDMIHNLNGGISDFRIQDNGVDHFQVSSAGNVNTGGNVFFNFGSTAGTLLASMVADGNDGRFYIYENGISQIELDANTGSVFNQQGLDRDFRIESDLSATMLFVNSGINGIGMNTAAITATLSVNGTANKPGGGAWAVFSDRRLKKDISDYKEGLDLITKVRTVNFVYNDKMDEIWGECLEIKDKVYQGVIAQELQEIAPDMVREITIEKAQNPEEEIFDSETEVIEETYLEVDPNKFTYALINAVQEQQELILDLTKDIETLKAEKAASIQKVPSNIEDLLQANMASIQLENEALKGEIDLLIEENGVLQEENEAIKLRLENIENMLQQLIDTED